MQFSMIVYLDSLKTYERCLDSLIKQNYDQWEIIIVSEADYAKELTKYTKDKRCLYYRIAKHNIGYGRNYGVAKAHGDYLLFVNDSDSLSLDLLANLNKALKQDPVDVLKFQCTEVNEAYLYTKDDLSNTFTSLNGSMAFELLQYDQLGFASFLCAYRRAYYLKEHFKFNNTVTNPDLGLIPLVILKAQSVSAIPMIGYKYTLTNQKLALDSVRLFTSYLTNDYSHIDAEIKKDVLSYGARTILKQGRKLEGDDLKTFIDLVKANNLTSYLNGSKLQIKLINKYLTFYIKHLA